MGSMAISWIKIMNVIEPIYLTESCESELLPEMKDQTATI